MKPASPQKAIGRLKVRIPFVFEAEAEGFAPVVCVAIIAVLFIGLYFVLGRP